MSVTSTSAQNWCGGLLQMLFMLKGLLSIALVGTLSCTAQDVPAAVKNSFEKNFPGIAVKEWDKEEDKYEANFSENGKTMSATFTADGVLKETETDIKIETLPAAVTSYIQSNYKNATIKEAAIIVRGDSKMYEAEVKGKDLLFDEQGKFLKEE